MTATPTPLPRPTHTPVPAARVAGLALAAALGLAAWVTGRKPLHAVGSTWGADLRIDSPVPELDVPLLAERGVHPCTVRVSRALSTQPGCWDIGGLAMRIPGAGSSGRPADLLFATTGLGRVSRYVLRPVRWATGRSLTTLLPTRAGERSVALLATPALPRDDEATSREYELGVSLDRSPWQVVGLLQLHVEHADAGARFDPIVNQLAGTRPPGWVVAVREPAYRWSRRFGHGYGHKLGHGLDRRRARPAGTERSLEWG
jgi:hypothetical protein